MKGGSLPFSASERLLGPGLGTATTAQPHASAPTTHGGHEPFRATVTPRILFVDDELALVQAAIRALPYSGCTAFGFSDPGAALAELRADPHRYDALITDLAMPVMDGLELARRARQIRPDLPIILTSGHLRHEDLRQADLLGIDAVVPKPCSMDALAERATKALLRRRRSAASS